MNEFGPNDPTREDIDNFISSLPYKDELGGADIEEAIYWYGYHWHSGQDSNLYKVLCNSNWDPGPLSVGPHSGSISDLLCDDLTFQFEEDFREACLVAEKEDLEDDYVYAMILEESIDRAEYARYLQELDEGRV